MNDYPKVIMAQKSSINIKAIFLEAFFVVLGVVLAFAANEWRENRNHKNHAQQALSTIVDEIVTNQKAVEEKLAYHSYLIDTLSAYLTGHTENPKPDYRVFSKGFISPAYPLSTAWDVAQATDALSAMDYQDVLILSRIYNLQERYNFQSQSIAGNIYEIMLTTGSENILDNTNNLLSVLHMFTFREKELIRNFKEVLKEVNIEKKPSGISE